MVQKHLIPYHEKKLGQLFCDNKAQDIFLNYLLNFLIMYVFLIYILWLCDFTFSSFTHERAEEKLDLKKSNWNYWNSLT